MSILTAIKPQKREDRVNVFVDGRFAFSLAAETLVKAALKINQEISPEEIQKLVEEDDFLKVYGRALKFLSFRPRSEKELKDWFFKKNIGEETQKIIYQKLKDLGYINDEEFAKWWIEQRTAFRPTGERLLALELKQKGISEEIMSNVRCQMSNVRELELAKKAAERKLRVLKNLPPLELKQKLTAHLARRGFGWDTIEEALDEALKKH